MRRTCRCLLILVLGMFFCAWDVQAAPQRVLVLPFAVNASSASSQLTRDVPALVRQNLERHGLKAVPTSYASAGSLSPAAARSRAAGAKTQYAVWGSLNQIGQGFSLDMQMVDTASGSSRTFHQEGENLLELNPVVSALVGQAVAAMPAAASSPSDGAQPSRAAVKGGIADIQVKGLKILDADRVLMRVSTHKGDSVNHDAIDEDVRNIWDLGYFTDVNADVIPGAGGPVLVFTVVEKPRIESVRVEGSDAVRLSDINEAMTTHTGSVLNEKVLADDLQKVTDLYHKKGF
ncbi:MAG: outer membrane protein assembly factor BamA, partial [Mailhella sp.]|nr:outer membrane protein assembly factor BamA [Mailhella sp.]